MQKEKPNKKAALKEITEEKETLYDAQVVDACLNLFSEHRFKFT